MDEKRKEHYHELDSLIHSDSFSERIGVWSIDNKHNTIWGWIVPHMETTQLHLLFFSDSFEETFIFFIQYFPNTIFATSFSDNQFKVRKLFKVSLYLA